MRIVRGKVAYPALPHSFRPPSRGTSRGSLAVCHRYCRRHQRTTEPFRTSPSGTTFPGTNSSNALGSHDRWLGTEHRTVGAIFFALRTSAAPLASGRISTGRLGLCAPGVPVRKNGSYVSYSRTATWEFLSIFLHGSSRRRALLERLTEHLSW